MIIYLRNDITVKSISEFNKIPSVNTILRSSRIHVFQLFPNVNADWLRSLYDGETTSTRFFPLPFAFAFDVDVNTQVIYSITEENLHFHHNKSN